MVGGRGRRRGKERERGREVYGELEKRAGQESRISKERKAPQNIE